ncbi:MAG: hypothetical protein QXD83_07645 [Sulfolobales archaeon]
MSTFQFIGIKQDADVLFTADDVAKLRLYTVVFEPHLSVRNPFSGLMGLLHEYVLHLLSSTLGRNIYVELRGRIFFIYSRSGFGLTQIGAVDVDWEGREAYGFVDRRFLRPEELKQVVEALGSAALGVAFALVEKLSGLEGCESATFCSGFLGSIIECLDSLAREGVLLVPDQDVYSKVMEFLTDFMFPFVSEVPVGESDFDEVDSLYTGVSDVLYSEEYEDVAERLEKVTVRLDGGMTASVMVGSGNTLLVILSYGPLEYFTSLRLVADFRSVSNPTYIFAKGYIEEVRHAVPPKLFEEFVDVVKNRFAHTTQAISKAAEKLESSTDLPREAASTVANYLRAWHNLLIKYGSKIEENRRPY